jgi:hypothetical protein
MRPASSSAALSPSTSIPVSMTTYVRSAISCARWPKHSFSYSMRFPARTADCCGYRVHDLSFYALDRLRGYCFCLS